MSPIEERLIEPPLIEKSTDPPSCCAGAAVVAHVKRLARIGVGWGEFRCQRECETNRCVRVCACVPTALTVPAKISGAEDNYFSFSINISLRFEKRVVTGYHSIEMSSRG